MFLIFFVLCLRNFISAKAIVFLSVCFFLLFLPKVIHFRVEILFYARLSQCWIFSPSRESKDHIDYLIIGAYPLRPQDWPHNHHCAALVKQNHIVDVFSDQLDQKKGFKHNRNKYNRSKTKSLGDKNEYYLRPYRILIVL